VWTPAASPPPFLILHGAGDKTVPYAQAAAMAEKLKAAGAPARLFTAPDAPHTFWASKQWYWPTLKAMESFLLDIFSK
jgi:dipeptidyl aminopeptidase/acylaminoacyl peptidase